jgi:hypothetical protein
MQSSNSATYPPNLVSKLVRRHTGRLSKRDNLLTAGEGGGGGQGAESYDQKKAWSALNHQYSLVSAKSPMGEIPSVRQLLQSATHPH